MEKSLAHSRAVATAAKSAKSVEQSINDALSEMQNSKCARANVIDANVINSCH